MSRDVHEAVLPGHERAKVSPRPFSERRFIRAVDDDHVHAEAWNDDPADRLPDCGGMAKPGRCLLDCASLGGKRFLAHSALGRELVLELLGKLVLLPSGVQPRERVLPLPDDDHPGQGESTDAGQSDSRNPSKSAHSS